MRKILSLVVLVACCAPAALPQGQNRNRKRVAVLSFDYATVQNAVAALFGSNQDVGKGISDMLVDRLVNDGAYSVIERKELDKVLAEQNFSNSDRADNATAAKIGRILGVDAIVTGSITQFGRDDREMNTGAFGRGALDRYGLGKLGTKSSKAVVAVTARIIDTSTGEILASSTGKGESARSGANILGAGGGSGGDGGGAFGIGSSNFGNTLLGEAVSKAVTELAHQLEQNAGRMPERVVKVEGLVADVSGNVVTINVGSRGGLRVGDRLVVAHVGKEIKDPATGKVLTRREEQIGELVITKVDESYAEGQYHGSAPVKVSDSVKTAQ